jgi:anti-anti-sigma factor
MKINCEEHRSAVVLSLEGDCTCEEVDALRRTLQPYLDRRELSLVIDGRSLSSIDSAGLEIFLQIADEIRATSGRLCLAGFAGDALAAFQLTRLDRRFEMRTTIEDAARAVSMGEVA